MGRGTLWSVGDIAALRPDVGRRPVGSVVPVEPCRPVPGRFGLGCCLPGMQVGEKGGELVYRGAAACEVDNLDTKLFTFGNSEEPQPREPVPQPLGEGAIIRAQ